jgi:hypothetical protein
MLFCLRPRFNMVILGRFVGANLCRGRNNRCKIVDISGMTDIVARFGILKVKFRFWFVGFGPRMEVSWH